MSIERELSQAINPEVSYIMPGEQQEFLDELRQEQQKLVEAEARLSTAAHAIKAIEGPYKTLRDFIIRAERAGTLERGTARKLGCFHKLDGRLDPQWESIYRKGD